MAAGYEERAKEKRAQQAESIPTEWRLKTIPSVAEVPNALKYIRECGLLTEKELKITETEDAAVLLSQLASKELSAVEVTTAFSKRAAIAHQLTTCCTEMFFEAALATAKSLDEYLERTGKTRGPLHGLPISIKDSMDVQGVDTSIGIPSFQ